MVTSFMHRRMAVRSPEVSINAEVAETIADVEE